MEKKTFHNLMRISVIIQKIGHFNTIYKTYNNTHWCKHGKLSSIEQKRKFSNSGSMVKKILKSKQKNFTQSAF